MLSTSVVKGESVAIAASKCTTSLTESSADRWSLRLTGRGGEGRGGGGGDFSVGWHCHHGGEEGGQERDGMHKDWRLGQSDNNRKENVTYLMFREGKNGGGREGGREGGRKG